MVIILGIDFLDGFPPLKNYIYKVDNYTYHTDELGRVNKVEGNLSNVERGRYETQQGKAVDLKDGIKGTDDGGHLIANVLNGPGEQINYVPKVGNVSKKLVTLHKFV